MVVALGQGSRWGGDAVWARFGCVFDAMGEVGRVGPGVDERRGPCPRDEVRGWAPAGSRRERIAGGAEAVAGAGFG